MRSPPRRIDDPPTRPDTRLDTQAPHATLLPRSLRRAPPAPPDAVGTTLLLGRGRLLHPGRARHLRRRLFHPALDALERAPAARDGLPRAQLEALRLPRLGGARGDDGCRGAYSRGR